MERNSRAQAWGFDIIIAAMIFFVAFLFFYIYVINGSTSEEDSLKNLFIMGDSISDELLTQGYPTHWNGQSVERIGIADENGINVTKLELFFNLTNSSSGYGKSQRLFRLEDGNNYYINFSTPIFITGVGTIQGIGKAPENHPVQNLIKISRFTSYNHTPTTVFIYVWN